MARHTINSVEVRDHGVQAARPLEGLLRGLATLDARPHSVVTLHLDARWDDEQQRERARLGLKAALGRLRDRLGALPAAVAEPLERDLARADEYSTLVIKQRLDVGFEGIAAFYCEPRGLDLALLTHTAVPTRLTAAARPDVAPLARSAHALDLALVAVVQTSETRILELGMGGASVHTLEGDVPDRVQRGGWRQLRIQKHIADHILHHHREAARELAARFDGISAIRGRPPRVVLGGREPALGSFERHLPERLLARAIRAPHIDPRAPTDELLGHVRLALTEALARQDRELLLAVQDAAAMGRGALGVEAVLAAVNEGRLRELLMADNMEGTGLLCTRCDLLGDGHGPDGEVCAACGGQTEPVALASELARRAVLAAAPVHTVEASGEMADWQGVAALLRY